MKRLTVALVVALGLVVGLAACGDDEDETPTPTITKAGWVYISPIGDGGWTYAHNQGRLQVEAELDNVETSYVENVNDGDPVASEAAIRAMAEQGMDIIFTTSWGYMDPTEAVAAEYPNIKFEHCSGYKSAANFANYFGRIEQARYLTGIVAGRMTSSGRIGYVAAFPIPEVYRGINGFTLGVRSVNPTAQIFVNWTHTWFDPDLEHDAATDLIGNYDVDIITQHQDTTEPVLAARDAGIYAIGYDTDMSAAAPGTVLTSAVWHWGEYYTEKVRAVQQGTWTSTGYWGGLDDGIVGLGQYGAAVSQTIRNEVATVQTQIASGTVNIFAGPILYADGSTWVAAGAALSDADQLSETELVQGVIEVNTP